MEKMPITRDELSTKVLAEIRKHPRCGLVKEIAITPVEILNSDATWHVNVIDSAGADRQLVMTIARNVQEKLSPLFEVID